MNRQATFSNPFWSKNFPDPFVLKVRGRYYAYATEAEDRPTQGSLIFPILTSTDLVTWHEVGKAMPALGAPYYLYWAPEVTMYNGQFLLYYAVHANEEFVCGIRVAVADRPEGPFIDSGHDLTSSQVAWAIDPHVFRNQDGQEYLYMTIEYLDSSLGLVGSGNAVDRLLDPFTLQGNITRVTPPGQEWQLYEAQRPSKGGIDWYTVEGPTVLRHRRKYYEMFSGGCYYRDNYAISYATSDTPMGSDGMRDTSWQDWQGRTGHALLVQGNQHVLSPGHNSFVLGPNNAEQYIAYHALQPDMLERHACLDRLFWHGDEMWAAAPTYTPQPAPAMPRIRELFDTTELHAAWQQHEGNWDIAQGAVTQTDETSTSALLTHREQLHTDWLLEVNLRLLGGSGAYGILLQDVTNAVIRLIITPDARLSWSDPSDSTQTIALPADVTLHAWHQIILTVSGSMFTVQFDGMQVMEGMLATTPHSFALLTECCSAAFSGVSLTDHFRDEFLNDSSTPALLGWHTETEHSQGVADTPRDWAVRDGALEQASTSPGTHIVLKGSQYEQCEFGATMRLKNVAEQEQAAFGLVLWLSKEDKYFLWLSQDQFRGNSVIVESIGRLTRETLTQKLPENFDLFEWHTLRLECLRDSVTLFLDGPELITFSMPANSYRIGLATRNTAAAFTGVWHTGRS